MMWSLWNPMVYPIVGVTQKCMDVRFPRFQGKFFIGCDTGGENNIIYDLEEKTILTHMDNIVSSGGDAIWISGIQGGVYDGLKKNIDHKYRFVQNYIVPPAVSTDGFFFAIQEEQGWLNSGSFSTKVEVPYPVKKWNPPALSSCGPVWIDEQNTVWLYRMRDGVTEQIVQSLDFPRQIISLDSWVFWVEDHYIQGWNCLNAEKMSIETKVVDRIAPIGIQDQKPLLCWSFWIDEEYGTDIVCSDNRHLQRKENQVWPSTDGHGKLMFRESDMILYIDVQESKKP